MGFQSVNEIEQFNFDDCQVFNIEISENNISMELEALIVRRNNSQNTNYTESYAGTTTVRFQTGKLLKVMKDGYKYYNADEVLINEIPDRELSQEEIGEFIKNSNGAYLYFMDKDKEEDGKFYYTIGIEFIDKEENTMADSYSLSVSFEKAVFNWERYMNRVQQ